MKYSILCSSNTGNTTKLAEAIKEVLPKEDCIYAGEPKQEGLLAPLLYIGFWTDKGSADQDSIAFLKTLKGKTIFLYGTAGFGGDKTYFERILNTVKAYIDDSNHIIGSFMCQGKMPVSVLERYEKMKSESANPERIDDMIKNFHQAETHPSVADVDALKQVLRKLNV